MLKNSELSVSEKRIKESKDKSNRDKERVTNNIAGANKNILGIKSASANCAAIENDEEYDNSAEASDDSEDEKSVVANRQAVNTINSRNEEGIKRLTRICRQCI